MDSFRFFVSAADSGGASLEEGFIKCTLCPRRCLIGPGKKGSCRVRQNKNGKPALPFSGFITALAIDPIEKKPLYHFRPGTEILSAGFAGCNLRCPFCQNWHISQNTDVNGRFVPPGELAAEPGIVTIPGIASIPGIAYTYSEPLVHIEYLLDCMKEARKAGFANVLVSNGCINSEAAAEVLELTDAANIDLKCFSEETYSEVLGGDLGTVLDFIKAACEKGVHIELTTLLVPGLNDSEKEMEACADFIAGLDAAIPWHLSAYHPDWKWKAQATTALALKTAAARARKRITYVYSGNIADEKNDTSCPCCGKTLISRRGYRVDTTGLSLDKKEEGKPAYFCSFCKKPAPVRY